MTTELSGLDKFLKENIEFLKVFLKPLILLGFNL